MTLIDKIVHSNVLLLIVSVFKLVYLGSKVEKKSDAILHNIHPRPFDPYALGLFSLKEETGKRG